MERKRKERGKQKARKGGKEKRQGKDARKGGEGRRQGKEARKRKGKQERDGKGLFVVWGSFLNNWVSQRYR